jgi:hypothetical protein
MIKVSEINHNNFSVKIKDEFSSTEHVVQLNDEYHLEITNNKISKKDLITKSFEFLLKKEPKESILLEFNLKVISKYFPDYKDKIVNYF